jgi:imidazolonepropionase-like amidohydrolase
MPILALLAGSLLPLLQTSPQDPSTALIGARLWTGVGEPMDGAVLLIENGRVKAAGRDVQIPPEATRIDLSGKVLMPGMIDAASRLFLESGVPAPGSLDHYALDAADRYDEAWHDVRAQGVTCVFLVPPGAGLVRGVGSVIRLDGRFLPLRKDAALCFRIGGGDRSMPGQGLEGVTGLRRFFEGARAYAEAAEKHRKELETAPADKKKAVAAAAPKKDPGQELLLAALDPKQALRVRVEAHSREALQALIPLASEFKIRLVVEGASAGAGLAGELSRARIPVLLHPNLGFGPPEADLLQRPSDLSRAFASAGAVAAIASSPVSGGEGGGAGRFMREFAALAVSGGMTRAQALAAVTSQAAKVLGIDAELGSLEAGRRADFLVLDGDPFAPSSRVEQVWMDGLRIPEAVR